ncbi:hypothetical protein NBRC10513v2_007764 [Rhodotorula toruloides]|uniref:[histone H3]-trimethyl-L-lysine(9) demethylase n=1 Tax=Rhodotorula toruloides TaxID=5286 RepID=A0A0K3CCW9_RHOTO|nr:hypothetical protein AAT19DRAFT_13571 [Rhodotorula toruloides]
MTGAAEPSAQAAHATKPADPAATLPSPVQDPLPAPASSSRTDSHAATAQSSDLSSLENSSSAEDSVRVTARPARKVGKTASPALRATPMQQLPSSDMLPKLPGKGAAKKEDRFPSPPQAPPTPAASHSSPEMPKIPLPSFVKEDDLSSESDSSSDEDSYGEEKPPRPPRFSKSTGLPRPRPSYYYDADYDPGTTAGKKKRHRRGGFKGVPVFEPSMEDFAANGGFYGYVKRIEKYGLRSGIVKVVPPKEWSDSLKPVDQPLRDIRLRDAIEQHIFGSQGVYRVANEAKSRVWSPLQWKEMSLRPKWDGPDLLAEEKKGDRSERRAVSERVAKRQNGEEDGGSARKKGKGRQVEEEVESDEAEEADEEDAALPKGRRTPARKSKVDRPAKASTSKAKKEKSPSEEAPDSAAKKKRLSVLQRNETTEEEWKDFVEHLYELPHGMTKADYTVERMRDFERRYWRTLTFGEPPMYGADMAGSLFDDSTTAWNVAKLGDLLPKLAPQDCQIPGVVTPYLYFGMWRATFAWHVEDADLYSINYIHFGAPKFWYSVPQEQAERFERVMEGLFPTDRSKCSQFLRHKAFLASPKILANHGITLNRCVQLPGEFILTYPKGYHSGFNLGFNCAESINFATERWLPLGKVTKHCHCVEDSVSIDVNIWLRQAAKEEHLRRGDPWPYDELEEQALLAQIEAEERAEKERIAAAAAAAAAAARKRASTAADGQPRKKPRPATTHLTPLQQRSLCLTPADPGAVGPSVVTMTILEALQSVDILPHIRQQLALLVQRSNGQYTHSSHIRLQVVPHPAPHLIAPPAPPPQPRSNPYGSSAYHYPQQAVQPKPANSSAASTASAPPAPPPKPDFPCALCPDLSTEGLVRVGEPGMKNKKKLEAHRICVMFTPATWIDVDPETNEEIVRGFSKIEKARWKLKCQLCTETHGTKVQCTKGKCTKAFHVTCAVHDDAGVHLDATVPDDAHEGQEVSILDQARQKTPTANVPTEEGFLPPASPSKQPNNDLIHLTVLCRTHNPDYQRRESERRAAELRTKVEALKSGDRIRVKTNNGNYDVTFASVDKEKEMVAYAFDDGKRGSVKWKNILWPESPEVLRKKEEAALRAQQEKAAILDRPAYKAPTKRANPVTVVPLTPSAPPPNYGYQYQPQYAYYNGPAGQPSSIPYGYAQPPHLGYAYGPPAQPYQYSYPSNAPPPARYPPPPGPYGPAYQQHSTPAPPTYPGPAASLSAYPSQQVPQQQQQRPLPPFSSFASMTAHTPPQPTAPTNAAPSASA